MTPSHRARQQTRSGKGTRSTIVLVAGLAVVAAVAIAVVHFRSVAPPPVATPNTTGHAQPGGKVWGREGAPVTIEVYSDFL